MISAVSRRPSNHETRFPVPLMQLFFFPRRSPSASHLFFFLIPQIVSDEQQMKIKDSCHLHVFTTLRFLSRAQRWRCQTSVSTLLTDVRTYVGVRVCVF